MPSYDLLGEVVRFGVVLDSDGVAIGEQAVAFVQPRQRPAITGEVLVVVEAEDVHRNTVTLEVMEEIQTEMVPGRQTLARDDGRQIAGLGGMRGDQFVVRGIEVPLEQVAAELARVEVLDRIVGRLGPGSVGANPFERLHVREKDPILGPDRVRTRVVDDQCVIGFVVRADEAQSLPLSGGRKLSSPHGGQLVARAPVGGQPHPHVRIRPETVGHRVAGTR